MCLHYNGKFTGANRFLAALPADQYWKSVKTGSIEPPQRP